ncbi:Mucin-associated surface protein (MASP) [Trypanosoma cruzi]|uniref:Mucin-associated surface protein (MASP), putative n=2 Tax=Trypanosoma cruzi TaxID=5693 RepID=Q4DJS1_TRYCC|nr:mucin-associated surface protein (MASP), putative [Trypanosoma cruzi]EAN92771.1 mucin-associated surface protein (MASP), putative [Trypanosoma cruzi]PWV20611.1 Mucin-associated surface protein (MASP) [Trypanosoma cruzi]|eukprot:XP_814622.1 mucin-associated surface protein (MASP) [Trypanosoma cruzi strain CL Brener]
MMMMTGRVLLVCALCVLWCGAGGGGRAEAPSVISDTPSVKGNDSKGDNVTVGGAAGGGQNGKPAQSQAAGVSVQGANEAAAEAAPAPQPGGVTSEKAEAAKGSNGQKEGKTEEKQDKEEEEEVEEDEEGKEEEEDDTEEEEENGANEEEETKKGEAVTGTTEGTSAGGQVQPILSSGAEGASNNTNPNSTPTTGDDAPAADGAGTREGKQNENKDANPKETPVEATAIKNTTATTGDSDGSTAASLTTSPLLLLLLVVACAAAVVAA